MKRLLTMLPVILILTAAGWTSANGGEQEVIKLKLDQGNGPVDITLDSEVTGFRVHDLQPGESRSIVSESGQNITVTRLETGLSLDVDGQTFEVPAAHHGEHGPGPGKHIMHKYAAPGLTIISGEPMDAARRETISAALSAAGITDEIHFVDHGAGMHNADVEVFVETEVTEDGEKKIVRKIKRRKEK
ncbi:MAG: hypothetical protein HKN49_03220 [Gammaproteobacteria bacterium]|nr:hypothetical protein [Gammaproteobacteria bacterium]